MRYQTFWWIYQIEFVQIAFYLFVLLCRNATINCIKQKSKNYEGSVKWISQSFELDCWCGPAYFAYLLRSHQSPDCAASHLQTLTFAGTPHHFWVTIMVSFFPSVHVKMNILALESKRRRLKIIVIFFTLFWLSLVWLWLFQVTGLGWARPKSSDRKTKQEKWESLLIGSFSIME